MKLVHLVSMVGVMAVLVACGGSSSGSDGGAGGAAASSTAGGGAPATTGAGGGSSTTAAGGAASGCDACLPPKCFTDVYVACATSNTCTAASSMTMSGTSIDSCFDNGVKVHLEVASDFTSTKATYYKADGSVCFTADGSATATESNGTVKDASGNVVATTKQQTGSTVIEYACGGQTYEVDAGSAACQACSSGKPGGATCTQGSCTIP